MAEQNIQLLCYKGTVRRIIFCDNQSQYYIAAVIFDDNREKEYKIKGVMPGLKEDLHYEFQGTWLTDKYGQTLVVKACKEILPVTTDGIEAYLASGLIKGIGPEYARRIVAAFGALTFEVLDNTPERLADVDGIGPKRAESIIAAVREQKAVRDIMLFLKAINISNTLAAKIYLKYGDESIVRLKTNPYLLADDIKGVGFKKADEVAARLGIEKDSVFRLRSAIFHSLRQAVDDGNTYSHYDELVETVISDEVTALGPQYLQNVRDALNGLIDELKLVSPDDNKVYLPSYYYAERGTAISIAKIASAKSDVTPPDFDVDVFEDANGNTYSAEQKKAISLALSSSFLVLTGGPGTGKTTVTKGIIHALERAKLTVLCAAPTGRAAKRMSEATGKDASTIHRLLEYKNGEFQVNEQNPLQGGALIIDESSMIDILLMYYLLRAVPKGMKVIMVGDTDQLPSVGSGTVLKDIINSRTVNTIRLTQIFRQAQQSEIVMNAYAINNGRMPVLCTSRNSDFIFFSAEQIAASAAYAPYCDSTTEMMKQFIVDVVTKHINRWYGYNASDVQVLAPMRRDWDPIGTIQLNEALQDAINPDGEPVDKNYGQQLRVGDKVMQIKNNYDNDVFNGDIGYITAVTERDDEKIVIVSFDDKDVEYKKENLSELELAYATTIHKSQGSEYPIVIIPVHTSQYILLQRQLLYTAVTRAKKLCIMIGETKAIFMGIQRQPANERDTDLEELLKQFKQRQYETQ